MGSSVAIRSGRLAVIAATVLSGFLGSNAIAQDNSLQSAGSADGSSPSFEVETGVNWLNLPSWDSRQSDFFGGTDGSRLTDIGLSLGFSLDLPIGQIGQQPLVLEWNGSIADLSTSSSSRASLAGQTSYNLSFGNTANGSINTLTATGTGVVPAQGVANVTVNDSAGGTANINSTASSPAGGQITQFASSSAITGGAFTAIVTNGTTGTAASYAAYGDNTGFTLAAVGDLSNSAILSSRSEDATVVDQTLLLGAPIDLSDGWSITPKLGPTYRSINRDVDFTQTIEIGASIPGVNVPEVGIGQNDELDARYIGALAGLSVTRRLQPNLSVTMDARLGGAYLHSKYRSQYSAIIPNVSIGGFDAIEQTRNDASLLAGLSAGIRYDASDNVVVGFDTGIDFTSKVPTVKYVADGGGGVTPTMAMSHALNYSAKVSVTWRF